MKEQVIAGLALVHSAAGLVFFESASPPANTETAPTGPYANSGWQHQIVIDREASRNLFFGTIISPKHFVTARHLGLGKEGTDARVFVTQPDFITGSGEKVYTLRNASSPSEIQFFDPDSMETLNADLYVYEIWETFPDFSGLYTGSDESGKEFVMTGFGDIRGEPVTTTEGLRGWESDSSNRAGRWGTNTVDDTGQEISGPLQGLVLLCDFDEQGGDDNPFDPGDADATTHECQGAGKDSGGGWFIKDGGVWKLAGINLSVDTYGTTAEETDNRWAIFDGVGLYHGSSPDPIAPCDSGGCNPYRRSHTYATRISSHVAALNAVIQPAKDSALLSEVARFEKWAEGHGLGPAAEPGGDEDGDGLSNLEEYLTESNPADSADAELPFTADFSTPGLHKFILTESLDLAGRGLTTRLEMSSDLEQWDLVTGTVEVSNVVDSLTGTRRREVTLGSGGAESGYYRLKVTL